MNRELICNGKDSEKVIIAIQNALSGIPGASDKNPYNTSEYAVRINGLDFSPDEFAGYINVYHSMHQLIYLQYRYRIHYNACVDGLIIYIYTYMFYTS